MQQGQCFMNHIGGALRILMMVASMFAFTACSNDILFSEGNVASKVGPGQGNNSLPDKENSETGQGDTDTDPDADPGNGNQPGNGGMVPGNGGMCGPSFIKDFRLTVSLAVLKGDNGEVLGAVDTVLYVSELEAGIELTASEDIEAKEVRLLLASVEVEFRNGKMLKIKAPSTWSSGLKLSLDEPIQLQAGTKTILKLERDQGLLIGGPNCMMRPRLRARCEKP